MAKRVASLDARLAAMALKIDAIDKRDLDQYETAKKIMVDSGTMMLAKIDEAERKIGRVEMELDSFAKDQSKTMERLGESLMSIDTKLTDIATHGTALARRLDDQLNHVKVNGGTYHLGEALQHIYRKLEDITKLTEGIGIRRQWTRATKELLEKDGPLHFWLGSKVGLALFIILFLVLFNSITHSLGLEFDIFSIINWVINIFK